MFSAFSDVFGLLTVGGPPGTLFLHPVPTVGQPSVHFDGLACAQASELVAGGHGKGDGLHQLSSPKKLAVWLPKPLEEDELSVRSDEQHLFVVDQDNGRVMRWRPRQPPEVFAEAPDVTAVSVRGKQVFAAIELEPAAQAGGCRDLVLQCRLCGPPCFAAAWRSQRPTCG